MRRPRLFAWLVPLVVASAAPTGGEEQTQPERIKAVLWVGGFAHDFDAFAQVIGESLPQHVPIDLQVVRDGSFLDAPGTGELKVIVMNHCFQSVEGVLTERQEQKLLALIRGGVGVVAIHASYYSFLDWPAVRDLYGATFTQHGSSEVNVQARLVDRSHPVTRDLPETFSVRTELYQSTPLAKDCHLLAQAKQEGTDQEYPSVWTHLYGQGRVVVILPAHWPEAYRVPEFQKLIANSTLWAARADTPMPQREKP